MIELGIANSSVFIGLGRIGRLDLLHDAFTRLIIPQAVAAEVGDVPPWVVIERVRQPRLADIFPRYIHEGESEVILLGIERSDAILVLDDWYARDFARRQGLNFIGTVGLILRAKREGRLQAVMPVIDQLCVTGFRLSDRVIADARPLAGE